MRLPEPALLVLFGLGARNPASTSSLYLSFSGGYIDDACALRGTADAANARVERGGGAGCSSISGVCVVNTAGRKNNTPLLSLDRLPRVGVSGSLGRPALNGLYPALLPPRPTRFRTLLNASTSGLCVRPANASGKSSRDGVLSCDTSKGRWRTGTPSIGESSGSLLTGEGSEVDVPELVEYPDDPRPKWKCQRPDRESLGRTISYPPILLKLLRLLEGRRMRPMTSIARPTHMSTLPHVPKNQMNPASSACQLLPYLCSKNV